ncbi:winged helix-turn-helix domain-containing protein [Thalassomonas actiniarum]|uniref:Winged helix-turn-helix domain-containing protein n=1 Tax=Thalassomonas actiniarum TaxID=485447 RepID=A0AAF0C642_9GAMM|nr:winged helix-turn-helix domain-containing protein [Thalassomonas actiniarum]
MRLGLKHIADGKEYQLSKLINAICDDLGLTQEQRHQKMPSGKQTVVYGRIGWAKTYLAQAELVTLPKRGYCVITARGLEALNCRGISHYYRQYSVRYQKDYFWADVLLLPGFWRFGLTFRYWRHYRVPPAVDPLIHHRNEDDNALMPHKTQ